MWKLGRRSDDIPHHAYHSQREIQRPFLLLGGWVFHYPGVLRRGYILCARLKRGRRRRNSNETDEPAGCQRYARRRKRGLPAASRREEEGHITRTDTLAVEHGSRGAALKGQRYNGWCAGLTFRLIVMENVLLGVGPEFVPGIAAEASEKTKAGPGECVLRIGFAGGTPGICNEIASRDGGVASEGEVEIAVATAGKKSLLYDVPDAVPERQFSIAEIARIFSPKSANPGFHRVAQRDARFPHTKTLAESRPSATIFGRGVSGGAKRSDEQASNNVLRAEGLVDGPLQALMSRDRFVGCLFVLC